MPVKKNQRPTFFNKGVLPGNYSQCDQIPDQIMRVGHTNAHHTLSACI